MHQICNNFFRQDRSEKEKEALEKTKGGKKLFAFTLSAGPN